MPRRRRTADVTCLPLFLFLLFVGVLNWEDRCRPTSRSFFISCASRALFRKLAADRRAWRKGDGDSAVFFSSLFPSAPPIEGWDCQRFEADLPMDQDSFLFPFPGLWPCRTPIRRASGVRARARYARTRLFFIFFSFPFHPRLSLDRGEAVGARDGWNEFRLRLHFFSFFSLSAGSG